MNYAYRWIMLFVAMGGPLVSAADHTKDSLEKVRELVAAKKALLVDVREKNEWDAGHIEGAKLVPLSYLKGQLSEDKLHDLFPPDKVVYLYCAGGFRCLEAAKMLEDKKLQLRALKPGYQTLLKEGFPIATPATDKATTTKKP